MTDANREQIDFWNGDAAQRWTQHDARLERMLAPVTTALLAAVPAGSAPRALDIGCGCGNQTLALARHLGAGAHVRGIDISAPMLALARERGAGLPAAHGSVDFLLADAATQAFAPGSIDLLFSRFGVMFFDDPVAAFCNLRAALAADGRLVFACWQAPALNAWFARPLQAIAPFVPLAPRDPLAPGPFAFADAARVHAILSAAGFAAVKVTSLQRPLCFAEAPSLARAGRDMLEIGPVCALLADLDAAARERALDAACAELAPYYQDGRIEAPCAMWIVTARGQFC